MSHDVFLSYARVEQPLALPLKLALETLGLDVFFDEEAIRPGEKFPERIKRALVECRAVVACWTPTSLASEWCQWECAIAKARGTLVPVSRAPELTLEDLGPSFFQVNYANLGDWTGQPEHIGWAQLTEELALKLEAWVAANPDAPDRPATEQKIAALRAERDAESAPPAVSGLERYLRDVETDLESTPWALQAPSPDAAKKTSELVVEVKVGDEVPRTLSAVHERAPTGRFVLLGDPGAGKTMALKHHGLWCLHRGLTPIYLRAAELRPTIERTLRESEVCAPVVDELMARVRAGRAALLVDSIDEVDRPDEKAKVRKRLAALASEPGWQGCPIFAASRSVGYVDVPGFQRIDLQPLSVDAMAELLARWEVGREQVAELQRERGAGGRLLTMCENPLLVTLMAVVLRRERRADGEVVARTGLYREAIDTLLARRRTRGTLEGSAPIPPTVGSRWRCSAPTPLRAHGTEVARHVHRHAARARQRSRGSASCGKRRQTDG